jgi:hypothetical protein
MLRVRSSSPSGRVIDTVVIGLVATLIAIFFTHDGTAIGLLRFALPPLPAAPLWLKGNAHEGFAV